MPEIKWILCSQELPKEDGWYAISYDGETWRHGIWMNRNNSFNESYGGWTLQMPIWWAEITPPNNRLYLTGLMLGVVGTKPL